MSRQRLSIPVLSLLFLGLAAPAAAQEAPPAPGVSVADLAWIAGDWRGEQPDGSVVEERWSGVGGGTMMGMFRWAAGEEVRLYEFMAIEPGAEGPVLRIKHFNPGLVGWEEKTESVEFFLESHGDGRAVFARDPEVAATKLVYERTDGGGLEVRLIETEDGEERVSVFTYSRP